MAKKGDTPWNKGKRGIYNEDTINKIKEGRKKQNMGFWITNGIENKKVYSESDIPETFTRGRNINYLNKTGRNILTLEKCIEKHGKEGEIIWETINNKKKNTLENFVKKYGKEEGEEKYNKKIERIKYGQTVEYYIEKYGEEGIAKFKDMNKRKSSFSKAKDFTNTYSRFKVSKSALKLFLELDDIFVGLDCFCKIKYNKIDNLIEEYFIRDEQSKRNYFYDFTCELSNGNKFIIEYNGIHVHADPKLENKQEWKHAFTKESFEEVERYDDYKKSLAEERNFRVYYIWSNDSKETIQQTIEDIKNENF